jgi:hypothetical protein
VATSTTLVKTAAQTLLAIQTIGTTANVTVGSAVDVSTKLGPATAFVKFGRTVGTIMTAQVVFRIEGSANTTGNDEWVPIYTWSTGSATTVAGNAGAAATLSGATTAGNTTSTLSAATGYAAGNIIFCYEAGTIANSEWSRVASMAAAVVTWEEAQTRSHTNTIVMCNLAEEFAIPLDLSGQVRVRLVVDASAATGYTSVVQGLLVTVDSASSV